MAAEGWAYRCSKCGELVVVDDISRHIDMHRAEPDYTGVIEMTRVDLPVAEGEVIE